MAPDPEKLAAALRDNMRKRKAQAQGKTPDTKTASSIPQEPLEPQLKPA